MSSQDKRCAVEMLHGTWACAIPFVPVKSLQLGKRASPTCPSLLIASCQQVSIELCCKPECNEPPNAVSGETCSL